MTRIVRPNPGTGPLPPESYLHALTNVYWLTRVTAALELITRVDDIEEVHELARSHLRILLDPVDGLPGIPDDIRLRWLIASRKRGKL